MKRIIAVLICFLALLLCGVCSADAVFAFESASYSVQVKKSITLQPILQGADTPEKAQYVWSSSDPAVCTVQKGKVTAKSAGESTVSCSLVSGNETLYTAECTVTVLQPVQKLSFNEKTLYLTDGCTYQLAPVIYPENASDQSLEYSCVESDGDASLNVSVSVNGKITVHRKNGVVSCKIVAKTKDGSGLEASIDVWLVDYAITDETISLTERKLYDLVIVPPEFSSVFDEVSVLKKSLKCVSAENDLSNDSIKLGSDNSYHLLLHAEKKGTDTILISKRYGKSSYKLKVVVDESACFTAKDYPAMGGSKTSGTEDAAGQNVSFTGTMTRKEMIGTVLYYFFDVPKASGQVAIGVSLPQGVILNDAIDVGSKVTVYGRYTDPLSYTTETGLTMTTPVITPEKVNDVYFVETETVVISVPYSAEYKK